MPYGVYKRVKPVSKETRAKMSKSRTGFIFSEDARLKISKALTGKKVTDESKEKNRQKHLGKKHTVETKRKLREIALLKCKRGDEHPDWAGGKSKIRYPTEFNTELKRKIRERDNYTCCICGKTEREELEELNRVLCVNHIDFDKNNCSESNLNTLCLRCNVKINRQRDYWTDYFNNKNK